VQVGLVLSLAQRVAERREGPARVLPQRRTLPVMARAVRAGVAKTPELEVGAAGLEAVALEVAEPQGEVAGMETAESQA
jgi:hypothetical protein